MKMNKLGNTGLEVSAIGFGGIVVMGAEPEAALKSVSEAVESGINYFDVAPGYEDAEEKLGPALEPFRKDIYLACKTHCRDAAGAREDLKTSMARLKTDYFDVYQLHGLTDVENDVKAVFAKGGAMEVILEAKKAGIIGKVGFSAHTEAAALAAMNEYDFDTVMYPVSFVMHYTKNFEVEVLAAAKQRGMGIIALKTLAKQKRSEGDKKEPYSKCWYEPIDVSERSIAKLALSWTLSQGVSVAMSPGEESLLKLMIDIQDEIGEIGETGQDKLREYSRSCTPFL